MKTCVFFILFAAFLTHAFAANDSTSPVNVHKIETALGSIERNDRDFSRKSAVQVTADTEHELLLSLAREVLALRKEMDALRKETIALRTGLDTMKKDRGKSQ
jgi:hypothetical protein